MSDKDALNWSNVTVKTFAMLQKICFNQMLNFWTFYSLKNPKTSGFPQKSCFLQKY